MVKISQLELENVKRIKACHIEPAENGLTVIGGKNNQGKTSVLDSIAWALGGDRYRPSQAQREGSVIPPRLHMVLSNGLVVDRGGKNGDLKVTDPDGRKGGQQILNGFVEQLALDLPRFMAATSREKALTLLRIIGVEVQVTTLERQEQEIYNRRHAIGQIADQKEKYAKELPHWPEAPKVPVSATELIRRQQDILAQNGENQRKRDQLSHLERESQRLRIELEALQIRYATVTADLETAKKSAQELTDESTEELERSITDIETINVKVRSNLDKEKAEADAQDHRDQYSALTAELEAVRTQKTALLQGASLPLPELSVEEGELTYRGMRWDNMSGSDQLKVSTAIVRAVNPKCGFVLLDKLEQMDLDTLSEFGAWMEAEGLQGIATRVSTGGECSVIIKDGYAEDQPKTPPAPTWKEGAF